MTQAPVIKDQSLALCVFIWDIRPIAPYTTTPSNMAMPLGVFPWFGNPTIPPPVFAAEAQSSAETQVGGLVALRPRLTAGVPLSPVDLILLNECQYLLQYA